ncbi:MAG: hypothetical protein ILP18_02605, partial [Treponema sp.]|nr:hypothetical protein [Treponema sp.]
HYVFPHGFHGLSVASEDFFKGKFGDPYTMEQVQLAVQAVKDGKGINVSPQRQAELKAQFPDTPIQNEGKTNSKSSAAPEEYFTTEAKQYEDVQLWTTLAEQWMKRI